MTADAFATPDPIDPDATNNVPIEAPRKLQRARHGSWLGGVCAGIANYFGWDATLVRIAFILSVLLPGPQFLLYIVLWIIIPREPEVAA